MDRVLWIWFIALASLRMDACGCSLSLSVLGATLLSKKWQSDMEKKSSSDGGRWKQYCLTILLLFDILTDGAVRKVMLGVEQKFYRDRKEYENGDVACIILYFIND